ncbi:MAG: hypothetical protein OSJ70_03525 [Bacilli bacterium]|nr:hypothetical protein [Bacilli bacterium]
MQWLIHSKLFKENLKKWLFMYIAVMGLLTSVITYSKYISNFQGSGDAIRSAKFNVKINSLNEGCSMNDEIIACDLGEKRPTQLINFLVELDVSELEVTTELLTRINLVDNRYSIVSLSKVDGDSENEIFNTGNNNSNKDVSYNPDTKSLVVNEKVNANDTTQASSIVYKVSVLYNNTNDTGEYYSSVNSTEVIQVGYTATQIN